MQSITVENRSGPRGSSSKNEVEAQTQMENLELVRDLVLVGRGKSGDARTGHAQLELTSVRLGEFREKGKPQYQRKILPEWNRD
ncbi:hypothetical protein A2U01_0038041 [Trifolium medium]|uniref:Uncharacterized protein n=1 Tax=Trifolium medium TaxID=97028 RepID=A0A392Q002_9FABA|nr:hypothetical protein [Trifolium medium]